MHVCKLMAAFHTTHQCVRQSMHQTTRYCPTRRIRLPPLNACQSWVHAVACRERRRDRTAPHNYAHQASTSRTSRSCFLNLSRTMF